MDDNQYKPLLKILKGIDQKLSILISLQKTSSKPTKLGSEANTILKLCNGKSSIDDIMKTTNKTKGNVKTTLSFLRKKGLIKTIKINKKTVYVKI